jgi:hypothetical protein
MVEWQMLEGGGHEHETHHVVETREWDDGLEESVEKANIGPIVVS